MLKILNLVYFNSIDELNLLTEYYKNYPNFNYIYYTLKNNNLIINDKYIIVENDFEIFNEIKDKCNYNFIIKSDINNKTTDNYLDCNQIYYIKNNIYDNIENINCNSNIIVVIKLLETDLNKKLYLSNLYEKLQNQILKPKIIVYQILDSIDNKLSITNNIIYNYGNELLLNNMADNEDRIIFINYTFSPYKYFTLMYEYCYQLYNCDAVGVNVSKNLNYIFPY